MPLEMPHEDLQRDFKGCVVMFKNKPVYILNVSRDGEVRYLDLLSQKEGLAPFTLKAFDAPLRRVGFVNCLGGAMYVTRIPIRKFYMGLNAANIKVKDINSIYPEGAGTTKQRIASLMTPEIGMSIMNTYPTLEEAAKRLKKEKGSIAFDTQFAMTSENRIYYRSEQVGTCKFTAKTTADIEWLGGKEHLSILLDNNHEKTVRDFRPTAA